MRVASSECFKSQIHETGKQRRAEEEESKGGRKRDDNDTQERGDDDDDYDYNEVIMINNRFVVNRRSPQVASSQTLRQRGQPWPEELHYGSLFKTECTQRQQSQNAATCCCCEPWSTHPTTTCQIRFKFCASYCHFKC